MSELKDLLTAQHLAVVLQNLARAKAELEQHLQSDFAKVKAELEETVAHFEEEVAYFKGKLGARIIAFVEKGLHPVQAVNAVKNEDAEAAKAAPSIVVEGSSGQAS